ncbi:DUF2071 domain-containing protein [Aggregicoccus sp. 17bor-14]|uniref:YqjF family protein n=1 Tax=Myxococcaceae TaxID=31 RepID=UPI00129C243D|nr:MULTISPECIES: DUF2071 domain-containing protein [Myxococcaceae]MBF5042025.1 DUF2071 domain-containing protein [Simulacricoccus sp. 17bor-14]MRI87805.1 DUF2071 domain-containing protein [Aggregicoccus sp. 17bor-14]
MRPFLTARWQDLLLVTWPVPDALLQPHLPAGLELDRHEGQALVSLVAFDFTDTRVLGVPWPGYTRFPELNLRFYVREGGRRGVCFLREYVPSRLVAGLARVLYNEPYRAVPYRREAGAHVLEVGRRRHRIGWRAQGPLCTPPEDSLAHFLKEHAWGFGQTRGGTLQRYEVRHPVWRTWEQVEPQLDVDLGLLYGEKWAVLQDAPPLSVIAAEGSAIRVFPAGRT